MCRRQNNNRQTGLLLVSHGTRSCVGTAQFLALVERIRANISQEVPVEPAFLELQQPGIETAVEQLVNKGIQRLVTMPLLLFAAGHAKEDVPACVAAALSRQGRSDIEHVQAAHFGLHPAIVELSRHREMDAERGGASRLCGSREDPGTEKSCLLLVGRGSRDESATAEMHEFAALRQQSLKDEKVEVAFLAMARPLLQDQLPRIGGQGYNRVIVQPHLLFHGELVESIERQISEAKGRFPKTEWIMTQPLADLPGFVTSASELIEKVILDRCLEAGIHVVVAGADD